MKAKKATSEDIQIANGWSDWSKEPSEFPWYYDDKETCYIINGEAEVSDGKGNSISFQAGDLVEFEQGLECIWNIKKKIVKKYKFG